MNSGKALSGPARRDSCIISSLIRFIDEKSQMKAPNTRAYFTTPKSPPSSLLTSPVRISLSKSDVSIEAMSFATIGTIIQMSTNATTLQTLGIDRKPASTSPNCS